MRYRQYTCSMCGIEFEGNTWGPQGARMCSAVCKANRVSDQSYRKRYGITRLEWLVMYEEQNGVCAVCQTHKTKNALHVDHCHTTGKVRGLLCSPCNQALGMLHDDLDKVLALALYLEAAAA